MLESTGWMRMCCIETAGTLVGARSWQTVANHSEEKHIPYLSTHPGSKQRARVPHQCTRLVRPLARRGVVRFLEKQKQQRNKQTPSPMRIRMALPIES